MDRKRSPGQLSPTNQKPQTRQIPEHASTGSGYKKDSSRRLEFTQKASKRRAHILGACLLAVILIAISPVNALDYDSNMKEETVFSRLFEPMLVETDSRYIYVTSFGNYSFAKEDGTYQYRFYNGTLLSPSVKFYMQYLKGVTSWEDLKSQHFQRRVSTNSHLAFTLDILNGSELKGELYVDCHFSERDPPKLEASFRKAGDWSNFRIVWQVVLPPRLGHIKGEAEPIPKNKAWTASKKRVHISSNNTETAFTLLVDWSDFGTATVWAKGSVVKVFFPVNVEAVDPTTIGQSTDSTATYEPYQRMIAYVSSNFWLFYLNGSDIVYQVSRTGKSGNWSSVNLLKTGTLGSRFSIWSNETHIAYVDGYGAKLYYRMARAYSNQTLSWLDSEQTANNDFSYQPSVSMDSNGYPYATFRSPFTGQIYVTKSEWNNGSWSTASGYPVQLSNGSSTSNLRACILPLASSQMYVVYNSLGGLNGTFYNGTGWETSEVLTTDVLFRRFSAVVDNSSNIHLAWQADLELSYRKRLSNGTWLSKETLVASAFISAPAISVLGADMFLVWEYAGGILYYKWAKGGTWSSTSYLLETEDDIDDLSLQCCYDASSNKLGVCYTTGSGSPYTIKFVQIPEYWVTFTSSPSEPEIGEEATITWSISKLDYSPLTTFEINVTRNGQQIVTDSSLSSYTEKFSIEYEATYTCSGLSDMLGGETFVSTPLTVSWVLPSDVSSQQDSTSTGGDAETETEETTPIGLPTIGLYGIGGLLMLVIIGGVYASLSQKKIKKKVTGRTSKRQIKVKGRTGGNMKRPKGVSKKKGRR